MQSITNIPKKRRRFSQDQISIKHIPLKHNDSIGLHAVQKLSKLEQKKSQSRKSMDFERISKCELNLDLMKRQTDWNKAQINSVEFQKIIEKRKQKNRFKFKTIELKSIQHISHNSIIEPYELERIKSVAVDFQIKHQQKFSLQKESTQFYVLQRELKELNDKQVQEKTRNNVLAQLIASLNNQISKSDEGQVQNERSLSIAERYSKAIKKQQQKTDFFIRLTNDIKQKIINSKKEIFAYRSQRVVYSSIFKQLEKELKLAENFYKRILINSISSIPSFYISGFYPNNERHSFQAQKSQSGLNSHTEYNGIFNTIFRTNGVKFIGTLNFNEEELLNDRINSNTAINYYLKSRKVIILPRYKEHYQTSRKKIKLQTETLSYEQLSNQINRLFQVLGLQDNLETINDTDGPSQNKKMNKTLNNSTSYKNTNQLFNSSKNHTKQNLLNQVTGSNFVRNSGSFQVFTQNEIEKVRRLIEKLPAKNESLFEEISKVDFLIDKTLAQITNQKQKIKLFEASLPVSRVTSEFMDIASNQKNQVIMMEKQLEQIQDLLGIDGPNCSQKRFISTLQRLEQLYIDTKTSCLFQKPQVYRTDHIDSCNPSPTKFEYSEMDTDRSNISIRFKKVDQNITKQEQIVSPTQKEFINVQKDLLGRSPQTLNSILKNIQVFQSYERAFQRIDFQKQYQVEKKGKKRTLIRRDGMVSLGLLKAQQKTKLVKRQSNKREQQNKK